MTLYNIKFSVNCDTKFGQVVYICGNTPQLGNWTPQNAMRLYTDATLYPKWDPYKSIMVRQGNKLLFKLCIVNQDKAVRWENIQGNREIIATQNSLVQFTAHYEEITLTPITEEIIRPPRKKTCDILNDLQSDGSSSKQYWKQFMQEQEQSILYITLTTHMRRIIQYQTQSIPQFSQLDKKLSSQQFDKNLQQKIQRTNQIVHKTSNFYCILENTQNDQYISVLGQDSYLVKLSQFNAYSIHNNQVPIFFHIQSLKPNQQNECCLQIFDNIKRIVHAQNILLSQKQKKIQYYISLKLTWQPSKQLIQNLIKKKVALVLIQSQNILQIFLQTIISLNLSYCTQDYTQITIFLKHLSIMKIKLIIQNDIKFKNQLLLNKKQRNQHENKYFDSIKKSILDNSNKSYIGCSKNCYIQSIKDDQTFTALIYYRKNILILNAQKIQDFSSKLLTQIMALSSKPNFEVYIILDKMTLDIKAKFPASKNNKIVVISKSGTMYANQQTFIDLFQNLNLQKSKFSQAMSKIQYSITLGLQNKQQVSTYQFLFNFKKGNVGRIGSQILKQKIKQHNSLSLHKLIIQQKDINKYVIKPFCLTDQFFIKSILQNLSKHVHQDRGLVITANMKNENDFIYKINTSFNKTFKNKQNVKMRNIQLIPNNQTQYSAISKEETINMFYLEAELQFICQHFLAGSHIKSYNLNMLSPAKNRRSFASKFIPKQYSYQGL